MLVEQGSLSNVSTAKIFCNRLTSPKININKARDTSRVLLKGVFNNGYFTHLPVWAGSNSQATVRPKVQGYATCRHRPCNVAYELGRLSS